MEFNERLKSLRLSRGITQDQFALELNLGRSVVSMYETGNRKPSFEVLEKIADYYNVPMDYLLCKTDSIDTEPHYYHDPEVAEMANELKDNPDMRILFDASKKLSKEDIEAVIHIVKSMSGDE